MAGLSPRLLDARKRLADGRKQLQGRHDGGESGAGVSAAISDLRDQVLLDLFAAALERLGPPLSGGLAAKIALVAHGGCGRRDVAPFSDVDLMILYARSDAKHAARLAGQFFRDVVDAGLVLGHSVRSPEQACRLSRQDPQICTSLIESRLLAGSHSLFGRFVRQFQRAMSRRGPRLLAAIEKARLEERIRFGDSVYLLEPNVKRCQGGLRDLQFVRWIGMARYGTPSPDDLNARGILSQEDLHSIRRAGEFLLWLRNEMHFHAGSASDVLHREEQVRIADVLGYRPDSGMLPVEKFMRDYFRHTERVSQAARRLAAKARSPGPLRQVVTALFGHRVHGGFRVDPTQISATARGLKRLQDSLGTIVELVDLANLYDKPIAPDTWELVHAEAARLSGPPSPRACRHFRSLLAHPARPAELLRRMHEARLLEKLIPEFAHARGLFEFNEYHKYTVDEHCFRAVDVATQFRHDPGPLGRVYHRLDRKLVLHLALLIHDLGKGYPEDHREVGFRLAQRAADRLGLDARQADDLAFLVRNHLMMNHLALRRDTTDEQLVVRFAVDVGSPERLRMLYLLTAADLAAVGPGTWNNWKAEIITGLYQSAMQHLAGHSPAVTPEEYSQNRRNSVLAALGPGRRKPWFTRQVDHLPATYLANTDPQQIAADLLLLHDLAAEEVSARGCFQPEAGALQFTTAAHEAITPGVFHKLTGALSSQGLEILSAEINTLADGLVLDRFHVHDPDYAGQPPPERLAEVERALVAVLRAPGAAAPSFRRVWRMGGPRQPAGPVAQNRVQTDNGTSETHTIFDVFAVDRPGLLYDVARTLFESGLSVSLAKIATYLDQVVDVFYVTDQSGEKLQDESRLSEIRQRLLEAIGPVGEE